MPDGYWPSGFTACAPQPEFFYFLHIPKTAGLSVRRFLTSAHPRGEICPAHSWDDLARAEQSDLDRYRVFSGHLMDSLEPWIGAEATTVTLLRDPVQRTISHYAHLRREPGHPHHHLARRLTLREFCLHPETRYLVENYQTGYLATRHRNPLRWAKGAWGDEARRVGITVATERRMIHAAGAEELLQRARARLARCAAVGVTERLADTLTVFGDVIGLDWAGGTPYENASYNRPADIDEQTIDVIRELTALDAILHREADARLDAGLVDHEHGHETSAPKRKIVGWRGGARRGASGAARRVKLGLAQTIRRSPVGLRVASASLYVLYRALVDRRIAWFSRLPAMSGAIYLLVPDVTDAALPALGYPGKAIALVLGCLWSVALVDKAILAEIGHAAMARFGRD